ncbi:sodium-coupled monocarboxylate transporter 2, partial [Trichonephila clavata]
FLELRYGKLTRYSISAVFVCQMVLYSSCVLYAPVLAINAVTGFSFEMTIVLFGAVCTLYCCLGGLKAVLWNDLIQSGLMVLCLVIVYIVGVNEVGGIGEVYRRAQAGNRLHFFE